MKTAARQITLFDLVQTVQDVCRQDAEVVAVLTHLVTSRRVVLSRAAAAQAERTPRDAAQT